MVADFDEFMRARSARLLRVAYLLTQDHALAEDLLQTALARSWSAWQRIDGDPEPYVRRVLVNTYNSWWRRRWNGERPAAELPDTASESPQSNVDDRDEIWRALKRLPKQQRIVLVLRYFEDLSEAQIAEAMSISTGAVKHYASKGLAKLRLDPSLVPQPVMLESPSGTPRVAAVHERIRTRRRTRIAAAAAVVIVAILSAMLLIPGRAERPEPIAPPTEFFDGKKVVGGLGWTDVSQTQATFSWTPTTLRPLHVYPDCRLDKDVMAGFEAEVTFGNQSISVPCEELVSGRSDQLQRSRAGMLSTKDLMARGIREGVRVVATVRLLQLSSGDPYPLRGKYGALIAQSVPFAQYPLPSQPAVLPSLQPPIQKQSTIARIRADGLHLGEVPWQGYLKLVGYAQSPGQMWINLNGVRMETELSFWAYPTISYLSSPQEYQWPPGAPAPALGTPVTVEIEISGLTGYWYVDIEFATS